jgi:hypothetical protein
MNTTEQKIKELLVPADYLKKLEPGIDTEEHAKTIFPFTPLQVRLCDGKDLTKSNGCTDEEILKQIADAIEKAEKEFTSADTAKTKKEKKIAAAYPFRMKNCIDVLYELTRETAGVFVELTNKDNAKSPYMLWKAAEKPITEMEVPRVALEKAEEKLRQLKEDADRSNKVISKQKMDEIKDAEKEVEAAKKTFIAALDKAALAISLAQVADQALEQLVTKGEMRKVYTNWLKAHKQAKKGTGYCTERSAASFLPNMVVIKRSEKEQVSF